MRNRTINLFFMGVIIIGLRIITQILTLGNTNTVSGIRIKINAQNAFISAESQKNGRHFNVDIKMLHSLGLPKMYFNSRLTDIERASAFVFVTYANKQYFSQLKVAVDRVQSVSPDRYIVVYDIGLTPNQSGEVSSWCGVKYRKFDLNLYPPHVQDLRTYAFKVLVLQTALDEFGTVFFLDATVLLHDRFDSDDIVEAAVKSGGFLMFADPDHSAYGTTHPKMYEYLPVNMNRTKRMTLHGSQAFVINNKRTYWNILHWLYMCALDIDCIAPEGSQFRCDFHTGRYDRYANCHRYDQSAMNLLAMDHFVEGDNSWLFPNINESVFAVRRFANRKANTFVVRTCSENEDSNII